MQFMNYYEVVYIDSVTKEVKILHTSAIDPRHIEFYSADNIGKIVSIRESEVKNGYYAVAYKSPSKVEFVELFDNYADAKEKLDAEITWCIENNPLEAYFYSIKWVER